MKNVFFLLLAIFFFSACSNGPNKITNRSIAQHDCHFWPVTDSVQQLVNAGLVHVDMHNDGNPLICDSVYTLQFNTQQEWESNHKGYLIAAIIVAFLGIFLYAKSTGSGNNSESQLFIIAGTFIICGLLISGFYFFNDYRDIRKSDYVHYMQTDGNLDNWWKLPAQSY